MLLKMPKHVPSSDTLSAENDPPLSKKEQKKWDKQQAKTAKTKAKEDAIATKARQKAERKASIELAKQNAIADKKRKAEDKTAMSVAKKETKKTGKRLSTYLEERALTAVAVEQNEEPLPENDESEEDSKLEQPEAQGETENDQTRAEKRPSTTTIGDPSFTETRLARGAVTQEVKNLTLLISGLHDKLQQKREIVIALELTNSDLAKEIQFQSDAYRLLRNDLRSIRRDYKKANREYNKGMKKVVEDKFYLKQNAHLQMKIVESNIDLLAETTVNDEVIPDVCREMRVTRLREQSRCLRQLRARLNQKQDDLYYLEQLVQGEEKKSDDVCRLTERLQHQVDDIGYTGTESFNVAQLRSVAYCLGHVQFQIDDIVRECEFTREMNSSRINDFSNELNWRVMLHREKVQALQTIVAKASQPKMGHIIGKTTERMASVSSCLRHPIPATQQEWLTSQMDLSLTQKQLIESEFALLWVEVVYRNARIHGKMLQMLRRLRFTLAKREQFLQGSGCVAESSNRIYI